MGDRVVLRPLQRRGAKVVEVMPSGHAWRTLMDLDFWPECEQANAKRYANLLAHSQGMLALIAEIGERLAGADNDGDREMAEACAAMVNKVEDRV